MISYLVTNIQDYILLLSDKKLVWLQNIENSQKFTSICKSFDLKTNCFTSEASQNYTASIKKFPNDESLVLFIGSDSKISDIAKAYSIYKGSRYSNIQNMDKFYEIEKEAYFYSLKYITIIIENSTVTDSAHKVIDETIKNIGNKFIAYGFFNYMNVWDLTFQIFKNTVYSSVRHYDNYMIAHDETLVGDTSYSFLNSNVEIFPYQADMDIFSFHGHGREDKLFIYNGYICYPNSLKADKSDVRLPHWKRDGKYYLDKKSIVNAEDIKCKIAFLNSCTSYTLGQGGYKIGYSISEGFREGYSAVTIGSNIIRDGSSIENILFSEMILEGATVGEAVNIVNKMSTQYQYDTGSFHILGDPEFRLFDNCFDFGEKIDTILPKIQSLVDTRKIVEKNFELIRNFNNLRWYNLSDKKIMNQIHDFTEKNISFLRNLSIQNIHGINSIKISKKLREIRSKKETILKNILSELFKRTSNSNYLFSESYHEYSKIVKSSTLNNLLCPYCNNKLYEQDFLIIPTHLVRTCIKCHDCGTIIDYEDKLIDVSCRINIDYQNYKIKVTLNSNRMKDSDSFYLGCEILEGNRYGILNKDSKIDKIGGVSNWYFNIDINTPYQLYFCKIYIIGSTGIYCKSVPIYL